VPLVIALLLALGSLLVGEWAGTGRMVGTALGAALVAAVLHLPWTLDLVAPGSAWSALAQAQSSVTSPIDALLRFETGPIGAAPVGYVFLLAGALPLFIGRSWRLTWAVRCWVLAAGSWGLAVLDGLDAMPLSLGPTEMLLAPAACGLALATGLGLVAFEVDLRDYRFGLRQLASIGAAVAVAVGTVPVLTGALDGDWGSPRDGVGSVLGFLDAEQQEEGPFRTLWLGDPSVLPLHGWQLEDGVAWGLTDRGLPGAVDRWPGSPREATDDIPDLLALADTGETSRLGRNLAVYGIRYVVVVEADRPVVGPQVEVPADVIDGLASQLDLEHLTVDAGVRVFRNVAWFPARAVLTEQGAEAAVGDGAGTVGRGAADGPALRGIDGVARYTGELGADDVVWQAATAASGWSLEVDGSSRERVEGFGYGNLFEAGEGSGGATLQYATPLYRQVVSGLQVVLWLAAARWCWRRRRQAASAAVPEAAAAAEVAEVAP
jgi:hypothetical protein